MLKASSLYTSVVPGLAMASSKNLLGMEMPGRKSYSNNSVGSMFPNVAPWVVMFWREQYILVPVGFGHVTSEKTCRSRDQIQPRRHEGRDVERLLAVEVKGCARKSETTQLIGSRGVKP